MWARDGECEKNPTWMPVNCKKSCNACDPPHQTGGSEVVDPTANGTQRHHLITLTQDCIILKQYLTE